MNELKPEDVMRALECCVIQCAECRKCPMLYRKDNRGTCYTELKRLALALLREKDAYIKKLTSRVEVLHEIELSYALQYGDAIDKDIARKQLRAEAITEFEDLAIKRICEKVVAPTPSESYIVEKCNQIIYETAKEMKGETDGKSDL